MRALVVLLLAALQPLAALDWDVAVSSEGRLDLLKGQQTVGTIKTEELYKARALLYVPSKNVFLFSNSHNSSKHSIYMLKIDSSNISASKISPFILAEGNPRRIQGIAYDPVDEAIYYGDTIRRAIYKANLPKDMTEGPVDAHRFHSLPDQEPFGLAIDHCNRKLYWSNDNYGHPSIESSMLDGSNREVLVQNGLYSPRGLTLDLLDSRLFWVDDLDGIAYSIESVRLDGSDKRMMHKGRHHMPVSIVLQGSHTLMWTDRNDELVWKMSFGSRSSNPERFFGIDNKTPLSIVVFATTEDLEAACPKKEPTTILIETTTTSTTTSTTTPKTTSTLVPSAFTESSSLTAPLPFCLNGELIDSWPGSCKCPPGFKGDHCEENLCYNYCLNGGRCEALHGQGVTCHCPHGKEGVRCERDVCLNGGQYTTGVCNCTNDFEGQRCEKRKEICTSKCIIPICPDCNCVTNSSLSAGLHPASSFDPLLIVLACTCVLISSVTAFLGYKVYQLSKRPRLKRRVIVSRREVTVPSFDQPLAASAPGRDDSCEIMIENCCNMTICETPCFEPPNRADHKLRKEDKKTLLANMDDSDVEELEASNS